MQNSTTAADSAAVLILSNLIIKKFDFDEYDGTGVKRLADFTKDWAETELRSGSYSRGDYRWFEEFLLQNAD